MKRNENEMEKLPTLDEALHGAPLPDGVPLIHTLPDGVVAKTPSGLLLGFSMSAWLRVPEHVRRSLVEGDW